MILSHALSALVERLRIHGEEVWRTTLANVESQSVIIPYLRAHSNIDDEETLIQFCKCLSVGINRLHEAHIVPMDCAMDCGMDCGTGDAHKPTTDALIAAFIHLLDHQALPLSPSPSPSPSLAAGRSNLALMSRIALHHGTGKTPSVPLWLPITGAAPTPQGDFRYMARTVPLFGRDDALAALHEFVRGKGFSWMFLSGSGGVGKSRLALEFCLQTGGLWQSGFLFFDDAPDSPQPDWQTWQPQWPCLMVIDYAAHYKNRTLALLHALSARDDLAVPVRVLVLERNERSLWTAPARDLSDHYEDAINRTRAPQSTRLAPLRDPWPLMESIFRKYAVAPPKRATTLKTLRQIDPDARPVFAIFLADTLARGRKLRGVERLSLLKDVLACQHEIHWQQPSVAEERLLALATILGNMTAAHLQRLTHEYPDYLKTGGFFPVWNTASHPDLYKRISGYFEQEQSTPSDTSATPSATPTTTPATTPVLIQALEPDVMGEAQVLKAIQTGVSDGYPQELLLDMAWALNPQGTMIFVRRLSLDFPTHVLWLLDWTHALGQGVDDAHTDQAHQKRALLFDVSLVILEHLGRHVVHKAQRLFDMLKSIGTRHQHETPLVHKYAKAAVVMLGIYGETDIKEAKRQYENLRTYTQNHAHIPGLMQQRFIGAVRLGRDMRRTDHHAAMQFYETLKNDAASMAEDPVIDESLALYAFNLTAFWGISDPVQVFRAYDEIIALAERWNTRIEFRHHQARAAANMIIDIAVDDMPRARTLYDDLHALTRTYPADRVIRQHMAQGAYNLMHAARTQRNAKKMVASLYRDIATLSDTYDDDVPLFHTRMQMLYEMIMSAPHTDLALYKEMCSALHAHQDDNTLLMLQARAALAIMAKEEATLTVLRALYLDIMQIAEYRLDDEEIIRVATRAGEIVLARTSCTDAEEVIRIREHTRRLLTIHGNHETLCLNYVRMYIILAGLTPPERPDDAKHLYDSFRSYVQNHPEHPILRERLGDVALAVMVALERADAEIPHSLWLAAETLKDTESRALLQTLKEKFPNSQ